MNIAQQLNQFNIEDILYSEAIKNTVIDNSKFIRIITSNENIIINGIFLYISLKCNVYDNIKEQKQKFVFKKEQNLLCISLLQSIEQQILHKGLVLNKNKQLRLSKQLDDGFIKVYNKKLSYETENNLERSKKDSQKDSNLDNYNVKQTDSNTFITVGSNNLTTVKEDTLCKFILKISGIWENDKEYGITYKFMPI